MKEQIRRYEGKFHADHDLKIEFDDKAVEAICQSAIKQELSIQQICDEILRSYQHGLNLIKQNTGQTSFSLPKQVVDNPDPVLEKWIRDSYHTKDEVKE